MSVPILELPGLWVSLDQLDFDPTQASTPECPYPFVYYVTIHNDSTETVTIKGRKWVLTDATGDVTVYEGDGIVGECPYLQPGMKFHYHSYHLVASRSTVEGAYLGHDGQGRPVVTRIPKFILKIPR